MTKKRLNAPETARKGSIQSVISRLAADSGIQVKTAEEYSRSWRYLDFKDPKTGLPSIAHEYLVGASGFRAGTVNQLRGLAAAGKSSLCMLEYASAVRYLGGYCAHIETEGGGMNTARVAEFGLNPDKLVIPTGANSFERVVEFIDTFRCIIRGGLGGSVGEMGRRSASKFLREEAEDPEKEHPILIGVDSLSNLGKEDDTQNDVTDIAKSQQPGWFPRQVKLWLRQKSKVYEDDLLTLFLTSQEIAKIGGASFLPAEKDSVAGSAIKFFDTVAIDMSIKDWKGKDGRKVGREMTLKTFKNKLASAGRKVSLFLTEHNGFDLIHSDAMFLLDKSCSPFADGGAFPGTGNCERRPGGILCRPLGDKAFRTETEFVWAFYDNKEVLDTCRDYLRIMGYGLPHETRYKSQYDENGFWIGDGGGGNAPEAGPEDEPEAEG